MIDGYKDTDNPAAYCITCDKFIGMRGFCSQECANKYFDDNCSHKTSKKSEDNE